ncbi:MAG: DUF1573 domain-containing protein [Bacteroidales bacterium]|jgi:hypothetical protein|nr:DUF1573 domain-containing protein [Bacteroidales bacterium]
MNKRVVALLLGCLIFSISIIFAQNTQNTLKAHFTLTDNLVEFGNIVNGKTKTIDVKFTNTGKKPLIISDVYTNCGCTEIDYPREPFMPGKSGVLKISYNAIEGEGTFNKTVTIYTNAENKVETIKIQGAVIPK